MIPSELRYWDELDRNKYRDERETVAELLGCSPLQADERRVVLNEATALVEHARKSQKKQGVVESFLQQYSLGTQ